MITEHYNGKTRKDHYTVTDLIQYYKDTNNDEMLKAISERETMDKHGTMYDSLCNALFFGVSRKDSPHDLMQEVWRLQKEGL